MSKNLWKTPDRGVDPQRDHNRIKPVAPYFRGSSHVFWQTNLPKSLCDEIIDQYKDRNAKPGQSIGEAGYRKVNTFWSPAGDWFPSFMANYIWFANDNMFEYDLCAMYYEECHMLEYDEGHYYHWHSDYDPQMIIGKSIPNWEKIYPKIDEYVRKLSFTLQLSDEDEYEGGDMELVEPCTEQVITMSKKRGALCIFDSRLKHRVLPVESGKRYAMVGWCLGPKWK